MKANPTHISFENGFDLELRVHGDRFAGVGEVTYLGSALRNGRLPWIIYAESECGVRFEDFRLVEVMQDSDDATIVFEGEGRWLPRIQEADAMGDARIKTRRLVNAKATFRWTFRPITEVVAENTWTGLAMRIVVDSPDAPIHWLLEDTTWEIGADAAGCVLVQQDISTIDLEQVVEPGSEFSTIERFFTEAAGAWGGSFPMDMLPRAAGSAICDFQAKGDTALCLFAERPGLTRSRIEKFADENVIHYCDRPFFPLTRSAAAPERKLLVYRHPTPLARHEWRNLWLDCFCEVRRRIHQRYDFNLEVPVPTIHAHLWDPDLHAYGPGWVEPLIKAFSTFAMLGYREVFTHGVWESVTTDPTKSPEDGNICTPYSFQFAELFGGDANMKRLCDAAHTQGISVYQWFGLQFARFSPIWKEHPDWLLREANGDPWDANYGSLWAGRMRSGYGSYVEESVKSIKTNTGLDNIFWDSYQNLGVTCVDWQGEDKAPQADEIFAMQARLQKYGFKQRCEVVTIFGVSQVAMFGFEDDAFRRRLWSDTIAQDTAFALLDTSPGFFSDRYPFQPGLLGPEQYFWLAAHRAVPIVGARPWGAPADGGSSDPELPGGDHAGDYARVNRLYLAALPRMSRLRLTEGGRHALWLDERNQPSVVWAFADAEIPYAGTVTSLESSESIVCKDRFHAVAGQVYLLENA